MQNTTIKPRPKRAKIKPIMLEGTISEFQEPTFGEMGQGIRLVMLVTPLKRSKRTSPAPVCYTLNLDHENLECLTRHLVMVHRRIHHEDYKVDRILIPDLPTIDEEDEDEDEDEADEETELAALPRSMQPASFKRTHKTRPEHNLFYT